MKIVIFGSGGVGGYFGGRLAEAGYDVSFIARGKHLEAMRQSGLRVESSYGNFHLTSVSASNDPSIITSADVVLLGVKLYDTESAAKTIAPFLKETSVIVSLQNGVDAPGILRAVVGAERVIGGSVMVSARIQSPGVIVHTGKLQKITFEESHPWAQELLAACRAAKLDAGVTHDLQALLWSKFIRLSALSGITCLTRQPMGPILTDPLLWEVFEKLLWEAVLVARAKGIEVADDAAKSSLEVVRTLHADFKTSMLVDLERGNKLEVEWLSGAVHTMGKELGVLTPFSSSVFAALKPFALGRAA